MYTNEKFKTYEYDVVVIGGGPAGLMSAITSAKAGRNTVLIEKNGFCGKKLNITGKGRCNVTNNCDNQAFLSNVTKNNKFLYKSISSLSTFDLMDFFESAGVPLKTERGNRVFPVSDKARDITDALVNEAKKNKVSFLYKRVEKIKKISGDEGKDFFETEVFDGHMSKIKVLSESVIICTGGLSYPKTGSTGDGYVFAKAFGHSVITPVPSLVPLESPDVMCKKAMGLSLKNVGVKFVTQSGKCLYSSEGEMLFTHFGVSGPLILSASAHLNDLKEKVTLYIDLKPALDEITLDKRLLKIFSESQNKDFLNSLDSLLPQKIIEPVIHYSGIPERKKVNLITKEERKKLLTVIKNYPVNISSFRPIDEAIVTSGGINVKEINPSTMESKITKGLYFAGEVIDVDCYTGGFNLQVAFSTGFVAGNNA
ncbi:MAG: NAD(P)/FAD-dependent oxidoreductase [Ruminococcaceae bacterium]|nr:NAD(P)/FAD-dependent oxidoreductase [Oscillospiraceae bacterium]